jgi:hypothetical protein
MPGSAEELRFRALSLKKSILTQPSVRELATNPLLLTTLALLHYSGGSLPKQRVELYRIAVQCLVEVWRNSGLMVEEVIGVLSPLAFHIHSHYPTGLIEQEKLKAIVAKSLAKARNIDPNNPPSTFENDVNVFLIGTFANIYIGTLRADLSCSAKRASWIACSSRRVFVWLLAFNFSRVSRCNLSCARS